MCIKCCSSEHEAEYSKLVTIIAKHVLEVSLVPQTLPQARLSILDYKRCLLILDYKRCALKINKCA